jgi:K+-sensing histidine kinase KdpD
VPFQEVRDLLAPPLLAKQSIQLLIEESPPLRIKVDPAQIKQVLINLVQNAADATGPNGVIKLRARAARRRIGNKECDVAVLEVADNGRGIPKDVQERLFESVLHHQGQWHRPRPLHRGRHRSETRRRARIPNSDGLRHDLRYHSTASD